MSNFMKEVKAYELEAAAKVVDDFKHKYPTYSALEHKLEFWNAQYAYNCACTAYTNALIALATHKPSNGVLH